jgi:hypothetical protein
MSEFKGFRPSSNREKLKFPKQKKLEITDSNIPTQTESDKTKILSTRSLNNNLPKITEILEPSSTSREGCFIVESYVVELEPVEVSQGNYHYLSKPKVIDQYYTGVSDRYSLQIHSHRFDGLHSNTAKYTQINSFIEPEKYGTAYGVYTEFKIIDNSSGVTIYEFGPTAKMESYQTQLADGILSIDEFVDTIKANIDQNNRLEYKSFSQTMSDKITKKNAELKLRYFCENFACLDVNQGYKNNSISVGKELEYWLNELQDIPQEESDKLRAWIDKYYLAISLDFIKCIQDECLRIQSLKAKNDTNLSKYYEELEIYNTELDAYVAKIKPAIDEILNNYYHAGKLTDSANLEFDGMTYQNQPIYLSHRQDVHDFFPENYLLIQQGLTEDDLTEPLPPAIPNIIKPQYARGFFDLIEEYNFPSFESKKIFDDVTSTYFDWQNFDDQIKNSGLVIKMEMATEITHQDIQVLANIIRQSFNVAQFVYGKGLGTYPNKRINN